MTTEDYDAKVRQFVADLAAVTDATEEHIERVVRSALFAEVEHPPVWFGVMVPWRWWQRTRWAWRLIRRVGYWYDRRQS